MGCGFLAFRGVHGPWAGLALLGVGCLRPRAVAVAWVLVAGFLALSAWQMHFGIVWRRNTSSLNFRLLRILPVVIRADQRPVCIAQV